MRGEHHYQRWDDVPALYAAPSHQSRADAPERAALSVRRGGGGAEFCDLQRDADGNVDVSAERGRPARAIQQHEGCLQGFRAVLPHS